MLRKVIREPIAVAVMVGSLLLGAFFAFGAYELLHLNNTNTVLVTNDRIATCQHAADSAFFDLTRQLIVTPRGPAQDAIINQERVFNRQRIVEACLARR